MIEVAVPIVDVMTNPTETTGESTKLIGYAALGVSPARERAHLKRVSYFVIGIGCVIGMLSLPLKFSKSETLYETAKFAWPRPDVVARSVRIGPNES